MRTGQMIFGVVFLLVSATVLLSPGSGAAYADELTMPKPIPSGMVQPVYPEQEKTDGIEGAVLLAVDVQADGKIGSIKAEQEVENHPAFTSSAIAAVGKWLFEPARRTGRRSLLDQDPGTLRTLGEEELIGAAPSPDPPRRAVRSGLAHRPA